MKITKKPDKPSVWQGHCGTCNAEATAETYEMRNIHSGDQREPGRTSWETCPACGRAGAMFFREVTQR